MSDQPPPPPPPPGGEPPPPPPPPGGHPPPPPPAQGWSQPDQPEPQSWGQPPPPQQPWGQQPPVGQQGWGQTGTPALRPVAGLAKAATILLGIVAAMTLVAALLDMAYAGSIDTFIEEESFAALQDVDDAETAVAGWAALVGLTTLATAVVFLVWQARMRRNAEALGAAGFRYGHALAVGCWFIPLANLAMPKIVINDLWRGTDPSDPNGYRVEGRPVGSIVNWWWALWIAGGFVGAIVGAQDPDLDDLESFANVVRLSGLLSLVSVGAAVLGILVVRRLTQRQHDRARLFGIQPG